MGACIAKLKDFDDPLSARTYTDVEPYTLSNRKIQKRSSQSLRRVHFAENDKLEQIFFITPRNSMSYNKLGKIWNVLDKDQDGILNFDELFLFASTVFLDVLESDVRDMLKKKDSEEDAEGLNFTEWFRILKNTEADIKMLVDDLYRVFCLGVKITSPNDVEEPKSKKHQGRASR